MNWVLLDPEELGAAGEVTLTGRRAEHLVGVLGVTPGQEVRVAVRDRGRGTAMVTALAPSRVTLTLAGSLTPLLVADLHLVLALPRPKAVARILRLAAATAVARLDLTNAWKVEKSYLASPQLAPDAIDQELRRGAEQGGVPRLPRVALFPRLMSWFEHLPAAGVNETRVVLDPAARAPLEATVPIGPGAVTLALGPEGGWIPRELATFEGHGFQPATLGEWVLTSEHAVAVALGQLALLRRRGEPGAV